MNTPDTSGERFQDLDGRIWYMQPDGRIWNSDVGYGLFDKGRGLTRL